MNNNVTILIPAYKPDEALVQLIKDLYKLNVKNIIVVNDGGGSSYSIIFDDLRKLNVHVVEHKINLGKGKALKTGFQYYLDNRDIFGTGGLVSADADGQHAPEDILKVAASLKKNPDNLILGVRGFHKNIPFRSKFGNIITKNIFSFLVGKKVSDTQTGLRGIPYSHLKDFIVLSGDKYEYEMNMLIATRKLGIEITEELIQTIYIEGNKSSHFNPLVDSIKIYWLLVSFFLISICSFLLDYFFFVVFLLITGGLGISSYASRALSMGFNYSANKKLIFNSNKHHGLALIQYLALAIFSITVSYLVLYVLSTRVNISVFLMKIVVEGGLFFFNFYIQNKFIFTKRNVRITPKIND